MPERRGVVRGGEGNEGRIAKNRRKREGREDKRGKGGGHPRKEKEQRKRFSCQ